MSHPRRESRGHGSPLAASPTALFDNDTPLMLAASPSGSACDSLSASRSRRRSPSGTRGSGHHRADLTQRTSMYVSAGSTTTTADPSRDASFVYSDLSSAVPRGLAHFDMSINLPYGERSGRLGDTRTSAESKGALDSLLGGTDGVTSTEVSPETHGLHLTDAATPCTTSLNTGTTTTTTTTTGAASFVRVVDDNASGSTSMAAPLPADDLRLDPAATAASASAAAFLDTTAHGRASLHRQRSKGAASPPALPSFPYFQRPVPLPETVSDVARPQRLSNTSSASRHDPRAPSTVSEPHRLSVTAPATRVTSPLVVNDSFNSSTSVRSDDRLTRTFSSSDPHSPSRPRPTTAGAIYLDSPIAPGRRTRSGSATAEFTASGRSARDVQSPAAVVTAVTPTSPPTTVVPAQLHGMREGSTPQHNHHHPSPAPTTHAVPRMPLRIHWCCAAHWRAVQRTERGAQWAAHGRRAEVYCMPTRLTNAAVTAATPDCRSPLGGPSAATRYECATPKLMTASFTTAPPWSGEPHVELPPTHLHDIEVRTLPSFLALTASTMYAAAAAAAAAASNHGDDGIAADAVAHPSHAAAAISLPRVPSLSHSSGAGSFAEAPTCEFCGRVVEAWPCDVDDAETSKDTSATCTITAGASSSLSGVYAGTGLVLAPRSPSLPQMAHCGVTGAAAAAAVVAPSAVVSEAIASASAAGLTSPRASESTTRLLLSTSEFDATAMLSEAAAAAGAGVAVMIDLVPASEPWTLADAARQEALMAAATQLL